MPFIAIAVVVMLALGGTVAVEHAQPGDSLYSAKSSINSHIGGSTHGVLKTLRIESNTQADAQAEAEVKAKEHANASSTMSHEQNHADDSVEVHGDAHVHIEL